jgi:hypothetical protein
MAPTPPPTTAPSPDLVALYRTAVETGQAGELVRALCAVHGLSLRGLAEVTGIAYSHSVWKLPGRSRRS